MAPTGLSTSVCFCGRVIRNDEAEEGSIYCSSKCARLDSMSALCAQESFDSPGGNRVKQVLRIGRKEALAKSSHYRRMERFGIGPSRPEQPSNTVSAPVKSISKPISSPASTFNKQDQGKKTIGLSYKQPPAKTLRPLLLGGGKSSIQHRPKQPPPAPSRFELENRIRTAIAPDPDDDDDASHYGDEDEDDDNVPFAKQARQKTEANLCSHFSDSSFGSSSLVNSVSGSTLSSMSSLTPSSSTGSLADSLDEMSFSTVSLASSFRSEQARLVHNIPCIPLNAQSLKALSESSKSKDFQAKEAVDSEDMPTPKAQHGFLHLDMDFENTWRFGSSGSQSALSDILKDF